MWFDDDAENDPNSGWTQEWAHSSYGGSREEKWDCPTDDWAVNPPVKHTPQSATDMDESVRIDRAMTSWAKALGAPETDAPALELRLLVMPDRKAQYRDVNERERESWMRWAERVHPEWRPLKPPRRLAPKMELELPAEKGWAVLALIMHNGTGYPDVIARETVSGNPPESLKFEWPGEFRLDGRDTEIKRAVPVGTVHVVGEWDWPYGARIMRESFPKHVARRKWLEANQSVVEAVMRKAKDMAGK